MSPLFEARALLARGRALLRKAARGTRRLKAERSGFYVDLWERAAREVGATVAQTRGELLLVTRGEERALLFRNYTDLDGPVTLRACGDKAFVHAALRNEGLPTPDQLAFTLRERAAAADFLAAHGPCVVKPQAGTGAGEGITTGIRTAAQLNEAVLLAAAYAPRLVIEAQIAGANLRLLYLDGELLAAVERRPPTVVGDGVHRIGRLVALENADRLAKGADAAQTLIAVDPDMRRTLAGQDLSLRHVPAPGRVVTVKTVVNDNAARDNVDATDRLAESVVESGRVAARALGVRLAGVDVITPDSGAPLSEAGGVVLEVNTTPGLYIHRHHGGVRIAARILEACLRCSASPGRAVPAPELETRR